MKVKIELELDSSVVKHVLAIASLFNGRLNSSQKDEVKLAFKEISSLVLKKCYMFNQKPDEVDRIKNLEYISEKEHSDLLILTKNLKEASLIKDDSFGVKIYTFFENNGFITDNQKFSLCNFLLNLNIDLEEFELKDKW